MGTGKGTGVRYSTDGNKEKAGDVRALPERLLHGGDYNPDQWLDRPDILEEDIRLMKKAHVNCVSLGIFAWGALEPAEGEFRFQWLGERIDRLYENGIYTILATPTGALPMWLSAGSPEVHQVLQDGARRVQGFRHNFCPSSPLMRSRMRVIDGKLSETFGGHPGVIAWHISNEYGGNGSDSACYCPLCQENFRVWLKERYKTLEAINKAWWTSFWSHIYTDWSQIVPPAPNGDTALHGLNLDWKRFTSAKMQEFMHEEIQAVRQYSDRPVVTNYMGAFRPYDYFKWSKELDVVSIDSYPFWHFLPDDTMMAMSAGMSYDLMRSMKKKPFLLMESVPSTVGWHPSNAVKRPGMHALSSFQAIAGGSNSVQYFQWRKGQGGPEKYHGAVLDHKNKDNTRVFGDVEELGRRLEELSDRIVKTCNRPSVALVYDWENWWAYEDSVALYAKKDYNRTWREYYAPFWELGIDVDIVDMDGELEGYALVVAPLNYMYRGEYAERVRRFVERGGVYVTTWFSGEVNDSDLCFMDRHPLGDVLGIRTEEIDAPAEHVRNSLEFAGKTWQVKGARALVHAEEAEVLSVYKEDFYAGMPALTRNAYGKGKAYFIASQNEPGFIRALTEELTRETGTESAFGAVLPHGVTVRERKPLADAEGREQGYGSIFFLQNFNAGETALKLERGYRNLETGESLSGRLVMCPYQCLILEESS